MDAEVAELTRVEFATPADLADFSYRWALDQLWDREDHPTALLVHPYAKHFADALTYRTGWRTPVEVHPDLSEFEWLLVGERFAIHSAGA